MDLPVKQVSIVSLPPVVRRLLENNQGAGDDAASSLTEWKSTAVDEVTAAIVRGAANACQQSLRPAPREFIIANLTRLSAHFWREAGETQWQIRFEDYTVDLSAMPTDIFLEGIAAYRRKGKFWPKVSELLIEMSPLLDDRKTKLWRLEQILEKYEGKKQAPAPNVPKRYEEMTPEDRAQFDAMMQGLKAKLKSEDGLGRNTAVP